MRNIQARRHFGAGSRRQRGAATLFIALMVLIILTIIVLASSNVSLFEQKTATNENRQQLADQAAEYALNLGGEYLKANVVHIGSNEDDDGWLKAGGPNLHWRPCPASPTAGHPCEAERDPTRRIALYYYTTDGTAVTDPTSVKLDLPTTALLPFGQAAVGNGGFAVSTNIRALLCRLDTTPGTIPTCQLVPTTGNRVAVTLVASATMADENAKAEVKETWATFNSFSAQAAVPLVAAGLVTGLGNATIVAAPNAGGYGLPGSIWSPQDIDIDGSSGGVGSVLTCHLGDYLQNTPVSELQTTCATDNNACGCDVDVDSSDYLSGHIGGTDKESVDVLDVDNGAGDLPDISFYPGGHVNQGGTDPKPTECMDDAAVDNDDNLFEWIFGKDVNAASTCDVVANVATEDQVLSDLGGEIISDCSSLDTGSSGLYYMLSSDASDCDLPGDIGSPSAPVVLVVNNEAKMNNSTVFGMVYVRDTTGAGTAASMSGVGNTKVFGSVVVEGNVFIAGGIDIVYVDSNAGKPGSNLPKGTRFARLPGSWLDSRKGF